MAEEITINELMEFLQENMATKDELAAFRAEVNREFGTFRAEVAQEFESFRAEVAGEFRMIRNELDDIKEKLDRIDKRTIEDADATVKDVLDLRRRVEILEHQLKQLQAA